MHSAPVTGHARWQKPTFCFRQAAQAFTFLDIWGSEIWLECGSWSALGSSEPGRRPGGVARRRTAVNGREDCVYGSALAGM